VETYEGNVLKVGSGRAWFNHTWTYNDSTMLIEMSLSDQLQPRYDAVVLEINKSTDVRMNTIKYVNGTAAKSPSKPKMTSTADVEQIPLCYVYRPANSTEITQSNITNCVGTSECPFVSGILEVISIDDLILQWQDQWEQFVVYYEKQAEQWKEDRQNETDTFYDDFKAQLNEYYSEFQKSMDDEKAEYQAYYESFKSDLNGYFDEFKLQMNEFKDEMDEFQVSAGTDFSTWFASLKAILDTDAAGHLQNEIDEITETEFNRFYNLYSSKTTVNDSTGVVTTETNAATITTKFATSDGVETITTTINMAEGDYNYIRTTTVSTTDTGDLIETKYVRKLK
jgi:hypothetical protein